MPPVSLGMFNLSNVSLAAQLNIYFTGKPITFEFDFCQEHQPFLLTVSLFGGGGYFGLTLTPDGIQRMAAEFEFGGSFSLNLGVASGGVHLMAGLEYAHANGNTELTGYLRCGGALEVLRELLARQIEQAEIVCGGRMAELGGLAQELSSRFRIARAGAAFEIKHGEREHGIAVAVAGLELVPFGGFGVVARAAVVPGRGWEQKRWMPSRASESWTSSRSCAALRGRLGDGYLPLWQEVAAAARAGTGAIATAGGQLKSTRTGFPDPARVMADTDQFARRFGEHPVIIVVCADLAQTHPTDTELGRLSIVGGASVYPMAQNLCLALRGQGVATTFTTLLVAREREVKELPGIPEHMSTACHIVAGYPARPFPRRLHRPEPGQLAFADRYGNELSAASLSRP